jgi:hypothetical protein
MPELLFIECPARQVRIGLRHRALKEAPMSKTLARATAPLFALALGWGLSACSVTINGQSAVPDATQPAAADPALAAQEAALDTYVAASQGQIPAIMAESGTTYSDMRILAEQPGTVEYAYLFTESVDAAAAVTYFDDNVATLQDVCDTQLFPEMASNGITVDPVVRYSYYNPDNSLIWTHDFYPS